MAFVARGYGEAMPSRMRVYSLPRWRVTRWLADCGPGVPEDIRVELIGNLFGNLPVFAGGVIKYRGRGARDHCAPADPALLHLARV